MTGPLSGGSAVVERVADHTLSRDMEAEDWQKAVAINGLIATGDDRYVEAAQSLIDRSIETQTDSGQLSYGSLDHKAWETADSIQAQTDPTALGYPTLAFYERTGDDRYLEGAQGEYEFHRTESQRTSEGAIAHHRGPAELWVDSLYMLCPFLARYGAVTNTPEAGEEAVRQVRMMSNRLLDPNAGLYRHQWRERPNTYPQPTFWARGNGWALAGLLHVREHLPTDHESRTELADMVRAHAERLLPLQDTSGFWHNILDDPQTPLETSGTCMFAYGFMKGLDDGVLSDEAYRDAARRAMAVCDGVVDATGAVRRVVGPPGGPGVPFAVTSYGQGWFLLAASRFQ